MEKIKLAVQKSGRLSEKSLEIIKECGISFTNGTGKLLTVCYNFPLEILFLRDDDIPGYVEDGVADIGIVGQNVLEETGRKVDTIMSLGFGHCRLSLAVPRSFEYRFPADLKGKSIATSYPRLLRKFLEENKVTADIHEISGSVEIAPGIGLADAICDLVSTGSTLLSNGLKEADTVFRSEAVLIRPKNISKEKEATIQQLSFRIASVLRARNNKYILLNAPNAQLDAILSLLPGIKSPTVVPLATPGWSSVHSVINENEFWENIEKLKAAGAEGILVMPIEKMIF
jgi:ATP phosphoribosyltransferase